MRDDDARNRNGDRTALKASMTHTHARWTKVRNGQAFIPLDKMRSEEIPQSPHSPKTAAAAGVSSISDCGSLAGRVSEQWEREEEQS